MASKTFFIVAVLNINSCVKVQHEAVDIRKYFPEFFIHFENLKNEEETSYKISRLKRLLTPCLFTFAFQLLDEDQKKCNHTVFIKINSIGITTTLGPHRISLF